MKFQELRKNLFKGEGGRVRVSVPKRHLILKKLGAFQCLQYKNWWRIGTAMYFTSTIISSSDKDKVA